MKELLKKWNIPINKISGIVTDNAKNIENACKLVVDKELHFPCFAHSLNLVVTNSGFKASEMDINDNGNRQIYFFSVVLYCDKIM